MRRGALLRIVAAALLLGAVLWLVDPRAVWRATAGADVRWLALGMLCAVLANAASALRWRMLVGWMDAAPAVADAASAADAAHRTPGVGWALAMYFRGVAINALLPGAVVGGDMYRARALTRRGLPLAEASLSVLFDRLSGLWMLMVLGLLGLAIGGWRGAPAAVRLAGHGGPALAAALLLLGAPLVLAGWLKRRSYQQTHKRDAADAAAVAASTDMAWPRRLLGLAARPRLLRQIGLQAAASVLVQGLSIATLACAGAALGLALPAWAWAAAAAPTFVMATLPVSFGGWGTREAAAALSFGAFGIAPAAATAISMFYGIAALAQALLGVASLAHHAND